VGLLAATLMSSVAPQAQAGVLWADLGYVSPFAYYGIGYYGTPSLVYDYTPYYFGGLPYYGYAVDYTDFYVSSPFYSVPWVWGFWDPPVQGSITNTIEYDEVITGPEVNGVVTGLSGIQVSGSSVTGNLNPTNPTVYQGYVITTTLGQLESLANLTNLPNIDSLLGPSILADPDAVVDLIEYPDVPIDQISTAAPEPSSFDVVLGGGLLLAGWTWRKRLAAGRVRPSV
jgi:hypothetical protein